MPTRAVLLDLDGTLIDSGPIWQSSLQRLASDDGVEVPPHMWKELAGATAEHAIDRVYGRTGQATSLCAKQRQQLLVALKARVAQAYQSHIPWLPDARSLLTRLSNAGVPTALVTSSDADLVELVLADLPEHQFGAVVCGDDVVVTKPHPQPYLIAAERLGQVPADCIAVEDSATGIASALAAGCLVVAIGSPLLVVDDSSRLYWIDSLRQFDVENLAYP